MTKLIKVTSCKECPYLRCPWNSALTKNYACGNSFEGNMRPKGEKYWFGGDALPGDKIIKNQNIIQSWCKLND